MTHIIAFVNRKGGVGKSTSCVNIGAEMAGQGKKVLIVDTDSQASSTYYLGHEDPNNVLYTSMTARTPLQVLPVSENLSLIPSSSMLDACETELVAKIGRERILSQMLAPLVGQFDIVLIDCRPGVSLLTINALCASTCYVICAKPDVDSMRAIKELEGNLMSDVRTVHPNIRLLGVLGTNCNLQRTIEQEAIEEIQKHFPLIQPPIRADVTVPVSFGVRRPLLDVNRSSRAAQDYAAATNHILSIL